MPGRSKSDALPRFPLVMTVRDGTEILVRQVCPDDKGLLREGMSALSDESRRFRFLHSVAGLTDDMLRKFTDVDHTDHEAVVAFDVTGEEKIPAGIARYIRNEGSEATAEVAVTIMDDYQGRGLGTLLLAILARLAIGAGIEEFTAHVLTENVRMLEVFDELGAITVREPGGETDVRIPLFDDASHYPETPVGDVFRHVHDRCLST